ncbi:MAG: hypothetical protein M3P32_09450 [Chloroflexota bacterium]|nr:hypothetical protein [Chloroflexota bacterium]
MPLTVRLADGCSLEENLDFTTGTMPVHAVNETDDLFNLELLEPTEGQSHDGIVAFFDQVQAALNSGEPLPTPPPWMTEVARMEVEAGQQADLDPPLGVGTYTVLCRQIRPPDELLRFMVLGPLDVTDGQ